LIAGIAAVAAMAAPAGAADMPMVYKAAPVVVEQFGGWYLRGDIGMTNQKVKSIDNILFTPAVTVVDKAFDTGMLFGLGAGYKFNEWFRVDVTGEYRGKTAFRGLDVYPNGTNDYFGTKSEWLFMANAYLDLGTWWCVTPFIGAGIGYSRNTIDSFRDVGIANLVTPTLAYANGNSQWEMAWAVHAGLAYKVNNNFTVEFAYRYLNLGDFQSGDLITYTGVNNVNNPMLLNGVTSHDFKLGLRWSLNAGDSYAPIAAPAYTPPPPAYSPPLMRKG
jgi:opacity protein-like surface antigen